ncbi:HAD family hydrolase [Methanobrevibacter millerae]|uniref:Haloacid dehalogenase-like hydrolase n=1 Tax=Methanobrevibacter millerae TaxID=230361 RepID=A0A1G5WU80_9EURY|nr:HAD hydrolase-like protein [Methanobrevibacter millerae]SDA61464.1 Haloacid dehalogenase-like hydrolase [Methanobrevibacter millerae]
MKKLAIFDFDGTILDSAADVISCFNEALSVNGFKTLTDDEYLEKLGGNIDQTVSLILKDENTIENMELIKNTYREIYNSSEKENTKPFEGVHETLKSLEEKGILLAIDSNRSTESLNLPDLLEVGDS